MQSSRHVSVIWGVVFVGCAAMVLLNALGNVPEGMFDIFLRALPAVLIFAGLSIVLPARVPLGGVVALIITGILIAGVTITAYSNRAGKTQDAQQQTINQVIGETVSLLQINIETRDTDVELRASDSTNIISGSFVGSTESELTINYIEDADGRGTFTFSEAPMRDFPLLEALGRGTLEILVPTGIPVSLAFDGDAGNVLFDMSNLALERLNLTLAEGGVGVTLPEYEPQSPNATDQPGTLTANNGDITIFVPESVAVRFELNRQGSGIDPQFDDRTYLYLVGDVLESRTYETAGVALRYIVTAPDGQISIQNLP
ncbi:MAG: hypothetical protein RLP44_00100 [Aggregatilineales bacterium]